MGKNWWRKVLGISESQRQLSRKLGIPLSGRRSRRKWSALFSPPRNPRRKRESPTLPSQQPPDASFDFSDDMPAHAPPRTQGWAEVKISARIIQWPRLCVCCGREPDTSISVTSTRNRGEQKSWQVPYCSGCLEHVSLQSTLSGLQSAAEFAESEAEIARVEAEEMTLDTTGDYFLAVASTALVWFVSLILSSVTIGSIVGVRSGSFGAAFATCFLGFLSSLVTAGAFGWGAWVWYSGAGPRRKSWKQLAESEAASANDEARRARQSCAEAARRYQAIICPVCCQDGGYAASYEGWYGTVHTFRFHGSAFAAAFRQTNDGKCL